MGGAPDARVHTLGGAWTPTRFSSVGSLVKPMASFSIALTNPSCRLTILTDLGVGFLPPMIGDGCSTGLGDES